MDSITRIKEFIKNGFPSWEKIDFSKFKEKIDFRTDWSELYKIDHEEIILISYTNISITGTDRPKPQLRVFLDEYKKPFYFAKRHQIRYYLFSIFTKDDEMAKGLNNFDPKKYIISIETNLDNETSRRDLRSIYDYANDNLGGRKYLKCSRSNYKADINQASFIYIGSSEAPEIEIFNNFITYFDSRPYLNSINEEKPKEVNHASSPLQQIFYGAPGTGKSNTIKREVEDKGRIHFRTTFHPDSDYSTFVGCYKPTMKLVKKTVVIGQDEKEVKPLPTGTDCVEQISYQFVPQAFTKAYCEAWNRYDGTEESEPVFLIIEEINRGNCAQIFGDIFQLLDRKGGFSEYPIDADEDLKKFLQNGTKEDGTPWLTNKDGIKDGQLCLPPNLYIWATMNTSDQSLFPIDSAFKRRWDWKYVKIKNESKNWTIEGGRDWWAFLKKINGIIAGMTQSADKQLGYYFCKPTGTEISAETFVNKVCFYLWNDVFKNFGSDEYAELFKFKVDGKDCELTFPDFFGDNGEVNKDVASQFIENVMKYGESQDEPSESQEEQA